MTHFTGFSDCCWHGVFCLFGCLALFILGVWPQQVKSVFCLKAKFNMGLFCSVSFFQAWFKGTILWGTRFLTHTESSLSLQDCLLVAFLGAVEHFEDGISITALLAQDLVFHVPINHSK